MQPVLSDQPSPVRISLIAATVGRVQELERLFASLAKQRGPKFEVIVVDQNEDDRLLPTIDRWRSAFTLTHLRAQRGLSRARNLAWTRARGDIIGFPDDDCWYPETLLSQVDDWFADHPAADVLCSIARDGAGRESTTRWPATSCVLDRRTVLRACSSPCLFLRRNLQGEIEGFDEQMGLGAPTPFQSAEDLDLVIRLMEAGHIAVFDRALQVYHPLGRPEEQPPARAFAYGMGFGYLLRKNEYGRITLGYHVSRAAAAVLVSLLQGKRQRSVFHSSSLAGRLRGYFTSSHSITERMTEACMAEIVPGRKS